MLVAAQATRPRHDTRAVRTRRLIIVIMTPRTARTARVAALGTASARVAELARDLGRLRLTVRPVINALMFGHGARSARPGIMTMDRSGPGSRSLSAENFDKGRSLRGQTLL